MGAIGGLLATLLVITGMVFIFGGQQAAGRVMASPFQLFGWMLRGILGAFGRGIVRLASDAHNYFYTRWPGWTLAFYGGLVFALFTIGFLAR